MMHPLCCLPEADIHDVPQSCTWHRDCKETVTMAWTRSYHLDQGPRGERDVWLHLKVTNLPDKRQAPSITFKTAI